MPTIPKGNILCRYGYDPLDRQTACRLVSQPDILLFYDKSRLTTEIQGALQTSVFRHDNQLLAQQRRQDSKADTLLLVTDQQQSVLGGGGLPLPFAYTPYGHRPAENGLLRLLGFNGERADPVTGHYHLGNGYRQFNPVLMRFNSPDSWSPFGQGGLNPYAYCNGDPRNWVDSTGHAKFSLVAEAVANFRKAKLALAQNSKAISRQSSAASTINPATVKPRPTRSTNKKVIHDREYKRDARELINTINNNETAELTAGKYTTYKNKHTEYPGYLVRIKDNSDYYHYTQSHYNFQKQPNPNVPHYFPESPNIVDATHFDITIDTMKNSRLRSDKDNVWRVEIERAIYIKKFTNIDLMRIRQ